MVVVAGFSLRRTTQPEGCAYQFPPVTEGLQESRKIALEEYISNYVALGLDLKKCDIYFQSERSKDAKKSFLCYFIIQYFMIGNYLRSPKFSALNYFKSVIFNIPENS